VISLLAPPTAGRREQGEGLAAQLHLRRICVGDLLRREVEKGTQLGAQVRATVSSGELVSDELVAELLERHLTLQDSSRGVLLDGFPRTKAQAEALEASGCSPSLIVSLEVHEEVLRERAELQGIAPHIQAARWESYKAHQGEVLSCYDNKTTPMLKVNANGSAQLTFDKMVEVVEQELPLHQTPLSLQLKGLDYAEEVPEAMSSREVSRPGSTKSREGERGGKEAEVGSNEVKEEVKEAVKEEEKEEVKEEDKEEAKVEEVKEEAKVEEVAEEEVKEA